MRVFACACVCIRLCTCAFKFVCARGCVRVLACACMYACVYACGCALLSNAVMVCASLVTRIIMMHLLQVHWQAPGWALQRPPVRVSAFYNCENWHRLKKREHDLHFHGHCQVPVKALAPAGAPVVPLRLPARRCDSRWVLGRRARQSPSTSGSLSAPPDLSLTWSRVPVAPRPPPPQPLRPPAPQPQPP